MALTEDPTLAGELLTGGQQQEQQLEQQDLAGDGGLTAMAVHQDPQRDTDTEAEGNAPTEAGSEHALQVRQLAATEALLPTLQSVLAESRKQTAILERLAAGQAQLAGQGSNRQAGWQLWPKPLAVWQEQPLGGWQQQQQPAAAWLAQAAVQGLAELRRARQQPWPAFASR